MNISNFQYDSEVRFELHDSDGFVEKIMDTSLEAAIGYFRDNFEGEGKFTIEWFDEELHKLEIVL